MIVEMRIRKKVSYYKYNKVCMIVDIEGEFRGWEAQIIKKYCTVK
jgi:hypothetical protein